MNCRICFFVSLLMALSAACSGNPEPYVLELDGVRWVRMESERLPDMSIPRHCHVLLDLNGEFTAIGGHTTGFVITRSGEYFKDGKWHALAPFYTHDDPFCSLMSDGRVLLGGGYEKDFGVGQTWGTEIYDPATHQFMHLPILDQKRTHANALTLADGRVVVSGNWYAEDRTEIFDGERFAFLHKSSEQRTFPYILSTAPDSAIVFGFLDTYQKDLTGIVDRLDGSSFEVPLLQEWRCFSLPYGNLRKYFIGDEASGDYRWLLPAANAAGERAFLLVEGEAFSQVPWPAQLPVEGPWGPVCWNEDLQVDAAAETVWIVSHDPDHLGRQYLACLPYGALLRGEPVDWTLYYSDVIEGLPMSPEALMLSGGRCLLAGGNDGNYYKAVATAMVLHTQRMPKTLSSLWLGRILGALAAIALVLVGWGLARRRRRQEAPQPEPQPAPAADLLSRITALMEDRQLFRRSDLRVSDVASELGTNTTYISACLNSQMGVSFPTFIARYRVAYAQSLMLREPGKRLSKVAEESGFADDASFFRTFKQITGVTPSEWKEGKI